MLCYFNSTGNWISPKNDWIFTKTMLYHIVCVVYSGGEFYEVLYDD